MTRAYVQLTDYDVASRPGSADLEKLTAPLSTLLTQELDGAADVLGVSREEILVAALGRAIERTIGRGIISVDVPGYGSGVHAMALTCEAPGQLDADAMLDGVHRALEAVTIRNIVHAVPDDPRAHPVSDVLFAHDATAATGSHLGHVLELRTYRVGDAVVLDWWFDTRSFEPYTVHELAEQLPLALIELTSEATPKVRASTELAMAY